MNIHIYHHTDPHLEQWLNTLNHKLELIISTQEAIMAKIDDLNAAFDEMSTLVTEEMAEIEKQLAVIANPGTSDADMDAAIARARSLIANIQSGVDRLKSDNA